MKAEEFRIGNFLQQHDFIIEVNAINNYSGELMPVKGINGVEGEWWGLDEFEPIPLTEEWLLKFGFRLEGISKYVCGYNLIKRTDKIYCETIFPIGEDRNIQLDVILNEDETELRRIGIRGFDYSGMRGISNSPLDIKYVHQLQNLFFALTGEELNATIT